jgi:hypothetical protein
MQESSVYSVYQKDVFTMVKTVTDSLGRRLSTTDDNPIILNPPVDFPTMSVNAEVMVFRGSKTRLKRNPPMQVFQRSLLLTLTILATSGITPLVEAWNGGPHRRWLPTMSTDRRRALQILTGGAVSASCLAPFVEPLPVHARNLPEPSTADTSKTGTVEAMIPVVLLEKQLGKIKSSLEADANLGSLKNIDGLLWNIPFEEKTFKAIFDAYSDPVSYKQKFLDQNAFLVYYSKGFDGPDRPNIESDLPVKQTLQLGARNDARVAWDDFLAELDFARSNSSDQEDLLKPLSKTIGAVEEYLRLSPPDDLAKANDIVRSRA